MKRLTILGIVLVCFAALCLGQRRSRSAAKDNSAYKPELDRNGQLRGGLGQAAKCALIFQQTPRI